MGNRKLSGENLERTLWTTLHAVRTGEMSPVQADAVATQAREITRSIRTRMAILKMGSEPVSEGLLDYSK